MLYVHTICAILYAICVHYYMLYVYRILHHNVEYDICRNEITNAKITKFSKIMLL